MTWFEKLFGFEEQSPDFVRSNFQLDGSQLRSLANGRVFEVGILTTPSLETLSENAAAMRGEKRTSVREVVADSRELHADGVNEGALFQVASQFNLLEMVSPSVTPDQGITRYASDRTQGPACAMSCAAGTVFRNYFADVDGHTGQTADRQIDCLSDVGTALGNTEEALWRMENGYATASEAGLDAIAAQLARLDVSELAELRGRLRIGLQSGTEVTLDGAGHCLTQAYCSALPVAYSHVSDRAWEAFARLILEAAYEATLAAGVVNCRATGNSRVFLTLLGGGAFGNRTEWIRDAIKRALGLFANHGLDVVIVSYGSSNPAVEDLVASYSQAAFES